MLYSIIKLIILYLLSIALWGIDKFHSYLVDYGWWKPIVLLYLPSLIIFIGMKKNKVVWHIINIIAGILLVVCFVFIVAYFMGYVDTFLGAMPLERLRHDDKFNIGVLIGMYILLKVIGLIFVEDKSEKH